MKGSIYTKLSSYTHSLLIGFSIAWSVLDPKVLADEPLIFEPITTSVKSFGGVVNTAILVAVSLIFLFFFYNLFKYISNPIAIPLKDQKKGRNKIKENMVYSLMVIVVVSSLWGLVVFIRAIFGLPDNTESETIVTGRAGLEKRT